MSIRFESADRIARVTLPAPERRNALTPAELAELRDVLAATAARFGQAFVKRGLSPDFGGSWLLPRIVGLAFREKRPPVFRGR